MWHAVDKSAIRPKWVQTKSTSAKKFHQVCIFLWLRSLSTKFQVDSIYGSGSNMVYGNPIWWPQHNVRVILSVSKLLTKRNETSPLLNHVKGNASRFSSVIQVLTSDIGNTYFSSFLITVVLVVYISMFISIIKNCIFYHCKFLCQ